MEVLRSVAKNHSRINRYSPLRKLFLAGFARWSISKKLSFRLCRHWLQGLFIWGFPMSEHRRTSRRVTKALRLAQSGEADSIVAAAKEILSTRIKHGDVLRSPTAVRDYLRLLLHDREHEVSMTKRASMRLRTHSSDKHSSRNLP